MAQVNTVLGPVDSANLGQVLVHEHIGIRTPGIADNWPERYDRGANVASAVKQTTDAKSSGIGTVIDLTAADMGRDVGLMREVAEKSGMHIVCATGVYWIVPRYWWGRDAADMAKAFIREHEQGIGETGVKPGAIKLASDHESGGVNELNETCLRAGARAHKATGIPILTHNSPPELGREQQRIFKEEGVELKDNVVIGHVGDTDDTDYLKELMENGSFIGMDRFGLNQILSMEKRVATVAKLCADGYADRMVLAHDACCAIDWIADYSQIKEFAPDWHMSHISRDVLPALKAQGVTDAQVRQMMVENPCRLLEPAQPY